MISGQVLGRVEVEAMVEDDRRRSRVACQAGLVLILQFHSLVQMVDYADMEPDETEAQDGGEWWVTLA